MKSHIQHPILGGDMHMKKEGQEVMLGEWQLEDRSQG
jgi:hypothetical protein